MNRFSTLAFFFLAALTMPTHAKIVTQSVEYKHGDVTLEGYLAYDDAAAGPRPGVLIVHEWWGLGAFVKQRAERLAEMGYVAFALDMYGKGVQTTEREQAAKLAGQFYADPKLMRARAKAGLEVLLARKNVDPKKVAAIGYCFGGTTVLQLAFSGADLAGVVSFHGGLMPPLPEDGKNIKAKLLVLHGADDPFIAADEITKFQEALRQAGADWQMMYYGGAVHSFTNPAAKGEIKGAQYHEAAERRSWEQMRAFFRELFGETR